MKVLKTLFVRPAVFAATLAVSSLALAAAFTVQDVNLKVLDLVRPFNNATTKMEFAFTSLNVDAVRALDFGFNGFVSKVGSQNTATLAFKKAEYRFGDGTKPTASLDLNVAVDLVKALGQETINEFAKDLDAVLVDLATDFAKDYGAAVTVAAKTEQLKVDAAGNVESIKLRLSAVIDMSKLPATKLVKDVEFQTIELVVMADAQGFGVQGDVVFNPFYSGFESGKDGMKEYVEKLLADDQKTYADLGRYLGIFDSAAEWLVELKP